MYIYIIYIYSQTGSGLSPFQSSTSTAGHKGTLCQELLFLQALQLCHRTAMAKA